MSYIHKITNKLLNTNSYFFIKSDKCILIDPGSDYDEIKEFIQSNKLKIIGIFATHGHFDHIVSVSKLQKEFSCHFYLHKKDFKTLKLSNFLLKMFGYNIKIDIPEVDIYFEGKEGNIVLQDCTIYYYLFPGHTSGSCIFKIDNNIFTGDTLLYSLNTSKIPNESIHELKFSQKSIFDKFDQNINFWPGHGNSGLLKEIQKYIQ
jgi:hydroxyacylglutathione hydrolase